MNEATVEATPQRILLERRSEYAEGFGRLLQLARLELRIFDQDLSGLEMNSLPRIEMLARFLRESRSHRIYIALQEVEYAATRCPRLIQLLSSHTAAMFIYKTQGDAAKVQDCFILADGEHLVRRPVRTQARGVLVLNDPKEGQPMRERFDAIWESSEPGVSANTSGL
jgi:hypothetical protein